MIGALVVGLLVLGGIAFVAAPLLRPRPEVPRVDEEIRQARSDAEARKHAALAAILDLESEHEAGKLSADELTAVRTTLEVEALEAMRALDVLNASDDDLEAEIAAMRAKIACPGCGSLSSSGDGCERCAAS